MSEWSEKRASGVWIEGECAAKKMPTIHNLLDLTVISPPPVYLLKEKISQQFLFLSSLCLLVPIVFSSLSYSGNRL